MQVLRLAPAISPKGQPIKTPPRLDIVIVNWNSRDLLRACVRALPAAVGEGFTLDRLVVVDNASSDGSADGIAGLLPQAVVLGNAENRGFAVACNQGAAGSRADYLLFLNPDVRVEAASLAGTLAFLEQSDNAGVGVAGVRLLDEQGHTQRCCAREPTAGRLLAQSVGLDRLAPRLFPPHFMLEWDHADTRPVDQVMGAFLVIRRELFEGLRGFDERFFVYYEDADLCLRVRRAGSRVMHYAGAAAFHQGRGTTEQVKARRLTYLLESRILFARKHFTPLAALAVTLATLVVEPIARIGRACVKGAFVDVPAILQGTAAVWCTLPRLLSTNDGRRDRLEASPSHPRPDSG
jgi:GT2 family glycosyltransferase